MRAIGKCSTGIVNLQGKLCSLQTLSSLDLTAVRQVRADTLCRERRSRGCDPSHRSDRCRTQWPQDQADRELAQLLRVWTAHWTSLTRWTSKEPCTPRLGLTQSFLFKCLQQLAMYQAIKVTMFQKLRNTQDMFSDYSAVKLETKDRKITHMYLEM